MAISQRLISIGFRVYGLGGDYRNCPLQNSDFRPVSCDLSDGAQVMQEVVKILQKESGICLIVNNAKYFPAESIAEVSPKDLDRALRINLLTPLLIARCALPGLQKLQGFIVNLGVAPGEAARGGVIGAATSGGLRAAHEAMFNEVRDYGVKVTMISPEPNRWNPSERNKAAEQRGEARIDPEAVANAVAELVLNKSKNLITEVVIRPRRWIDAELPPVIDLPFPEPKPIPYTVPREVIEAEEKFDEQELDKAERKEERAARQKQKPAKAKPAVVEEPQDSESEAVGANVAEEDGSEAPAPRKKRRRRGGRGRNTNRGEGADVPSKADQPVSGEKERPPQAQSKPASGKTDPVKRAETSPQDASNAATTASPPARRKRRRNRNRSDVDARPNPKNGIPGVAEQSKLSFKPSNEKRAHELLEARLKTSEARTSSSTAKPASKQSDKPAPPKKAAKKAVKKAARKAAGKTPQPAVKNMAKKAVKKAAKKATRKSAAKKSSSPRD
jgi:NADP-dependent 3-hydroxy acid dehydrogenase YdfG